MSEACAPASLLSVPRDAHGIDSAAARERMSGTGVSACGEVGPSRPKRSASSLLREVEAEKAAAGARQECIVSRPSKPRPHDHCFAECRLQERIPCSAIDTAR